jgi:hypothetical protein
MFIEGNVAPRHAKMIFLLLISVIGGYFVYNSVQTGLVLKIDCRAGYKDMFPLREIMKSGKRSYPSGFTMLKETIKWIQE